MWRGSHSLSWVKCKWDCPASWPTGLKFNQLNVLNPAETVNLTVSPGLNHCNGKPRTNPVDFLSHSNLKEAAISRTAHRMNGKSSHPESTVNHKEEDELNNDSDYISSIDQSRTSNADLSKVTKKRKSYRFFSGLRKRGSKYSSQESH